MCCLLIALSRPTIKTQRLRKMGPQIQQERLQAGMQVKVAESHLACWLLNCIMFDDLTCISEISILIKQYLRIWVLTIFQPDSKTQNISRKVPEIENVVGCHISFFFKYIRVTTNDKLSRKNFGHSQHREGIIS